MFIRPVLTWPPHADVACMPVGDTWQLMDDLRVELLAWQQQRGASGTLKLAIDPARDPDAKETAKAMKPPTTMKSFFSMKPKPPEVTPRRSDGPTSKPTSKPTSAPAASATGAAAGRGTVLRHEVDLISDDESDESDAGDAGVAKRLQRQYDLEAAAHASAAPPSASGKAPAGGGAQSSGVTPKPAGGKAKAAAKVPAGQGGLMGWLGGGAKAGAGNSTDATGQKRKSVLDGTGKAKAGRK